MTRPICAAAITALFLSACGGGSDGTSASAPPSAPATQPDPAPTPTANAAAGFYSGTGAWNQTVEGVILDDGTYYFVYAVPGTTAIGGLLQGTSALNATNTLATSNDTKNFEIGQNAVLNGTLSANFIAGNELAGSAGALINPGPAFGINFDLHSSPTYNSAANLATVAGAYTGSAGSAQGAEPITFTIGTDGSIVGSGTSGCAFIGSATTHGSVNVYDVSLTFGGAPCVYPGKTLTGIAAPDSTSLVAAVLLPDRSDAFVMLAQK